VRPTIRHISTIDGDDPAVWRPADAGNFSVALRLIIGPADSEGEESFDLVVCSPSWLDKECERDGFVLGRHHLIVRSYDFSLLQGALVKLIERCSGDTWQEVAGKLSRVAY
jgi:hypothetical protein